MNYCSSVVERTIEAVDRLLIAAVTSAWTSTLSNQHILPPSGVADDAGETGPQQENLSSADCVRRQG
jgi:hypothetical protein